MMRASLIILASIFISFSSTSKVSEDNALKSKLHGLWAEFYTEEGEILSYMHYIPEGKFHAYGYMEENKHEFWFAFGDWNMKGDQSCIRFLFDSYGMMNPNEEMCVTVLSVTEDTFTYVDNEDGKKEVLKRVSNGRL